MSKIKITGKKMLEGTVEISGAKNSAVALIPAAILSKNKSIIYNIPSITDIDYLIEILKILNCKVKYEENALKIDSSNIKNVPIPEELSREMRASYYFMGALLAKFHHVEMSFPGGCKIGNRPIDIHIKGFKSMGATVEMEKSRYIIKCKKLKGTNLYLDFPSVGATINLMLAALGADGKTVIENAAKEPEIVNIATFLINMGAKIEGAGTSKIEIEPCENLDNGVVEVFPDRIEAGTFLIIGALTAKKLVVKNIIKEHINAFLIKLKETGADFIVENDSIIIKKNNKLTATSIKTMTYPGFPTDLQQPFTTLLTQAEGKSTICETIYESRFRNTEYLNLMGADTTIIGNTLQVRGKTPLNGKGVFATDLRAGASLLIAALIAEGTTVIDNFEIILRGYDRIVEKLEKIGAKIELIE